MKRYLLVIFIIFSIGLCAGAKEKIQRYDDSQRPIFASKGTWSVGGTATASGHRNSNYTFFIIEGINSDGLKISAAPEFCWFFRDNLAVGGRVGFSHYILNARSGTMKIGTVSLGVDNVEIARQSLNPMAFIRYFIPFGESKRISMYVDGGIQGLIGRSKESDRHTGSVVGTYQENWRAGIFANPGIMAYFLDGRMAVFASLGIAGLNFSHADQIHNQVEKGSRDSFSVSFTLNPTALSIGLDFFIGRKK